MSNEPLRVPPREEWAALPVQPTAAAHEERLERTRRAARAFLGVVVLLEAALTRISWKTHWIELLAVPAVVLLVAAVSILAAIVVLSVQRGRAARWERAAGYTTLPTGVERQQWDTWVSTGQGPDTVEKAVSATRTLRTVLIVIGLYVVVIGASMYSDSHPPK